MARLRSEENEKRYHELIKAGFLNDGCKLCEAPALKDFKYWKIIHNDFPYDLIAKVHDMVLPKRHVGESQLTKKEKQEYAEIKTSYMEQKYEFILEPMLKVKSIPAHFHLHLIITKN